MMEEKEQFMQKNKNWLNKAGRHKKLLLNIGALSLIGTTSLVVILPLILRAPSDEKDKALIDAQEKAIEKLNQIKHIIKLDSGAISPKDAKNKFNSAVINAKKAIKNTKTIKEIDDIFSKEKMKVENARINYDQKITDANKALKDINIVLKAFNDANLLIRTKNKIGVQASAGTFDLKVLENLGGSLEGTYPSALPSGIKLNYTVGKIAKNSRGDMVVTISENGGAPKSFNISIVFSDLINVNSEELAKENMTFDATSHTLTVNEKVSKINYDVSLIWDNIKEIKFKNPENISAIGNYAFQNSNLDTLDLSGLTTLESIGDSAFHNSTLTTLDLSTLTRLKSIGDSAFHNSTLTTLDLSTLTRLKSIGDSAFRYSNLTTLDLSKLTRLESIGDSTFQHSNLTTLDLSNLTHLKSIGNLAFQDSRLTTLDLLGLTTLESIGDSTFKYSTLTTLDLSNLTHLKSIGNSAFQNSNLTTLDLSNLAHLKSIGNLAFQDSTLITLYLSNLTHLESIGDLAFQDSTLTTLDLSTLTRLKSIGNYAFWNSTLTTLDLSNLTTLKSIGDSAFDSIIKNISIKMSETLWKKLIYDAENKMDNRTKIFGNNGKNINWIDYNHSNSHK